MLETRPFRRNGKQAIEFGGGWMGNIRGEEEAMISEEAFYHSKGLEHRLPTYRRVALLFRSAPDYISLALNTWLIRR